MIKRTGKRVRHRKFGTGWVVSRDGNKVVVDFDNGVQRNIIDNFLTPEHWSFVRPMPTHEGFPEDWPSDAFAYDQAVRAVTAIMEAARPAGDASLAALDENDPRLTEAGKEQMAKLNEVQRQMGASAARIVVEMVKGSTRGSNVWGHDIETIRKLLGPVADRLSAPPHDKEDGDNG